MRRRARRALMPMVGACLLLAMAAACSTTPDSAPSPRSRETTSRATRTALAPKTSSTLAVALCATGSDELRCADVSSMELAPVLRIVDGDTLHVEFEGRDESVRLYGIDAPEVGTPCAADATERLRELAGSTVRMRRDARDRDRYKRLLRYVYTPSGESIDATLVREGLARAWRGDGALEHPIGILEADARDSARGCLWRGM